MADIFNFYVYDDRSIQFTLAEPIMLEDKDVTQFRFRIPKSLNGFDMSDWEWWFIFVNPKGTKYTTLLELSDDEDEPDDYSVATYTVGYGFSGIVGTVRFSIEALNVSGEEIINEWHTKTYSTAVIDTLQGLRAVIPEPDGQSSTGITEEVKQALLQIARKVAYIDEHGQTYYNALYDALYAITAVVITPNSISLTSIGATSQLSARTVPEGGTIAWSSSNTNVAAVDQNGLVTSVAWGSATITATSGGKSGTCSVLVAEATLTEISAIYTPSGTVYESDSLDSLKSRLVVTAHWSNGTTSEVASADYTLSGTLTMGTSTVTVSYGGMTTTFDVTVIGLTGITATYTQSGTVYDTDTLDSLKSDLVVTANYSDGTSTTVTDYTLSGTLTEGTSTVTVSYGGKTATFNVTVTEAPPYTFYDYLQGDGTAFLDTGLSAKTYLADDYKKYVKFRLGTIANEKCVFGARNAWGTTGVLVQINTATADRMNVCFGNAWTKDTTPVANDLIELELDHPTIKKNSETLGTVSSASTAITSTTATIPLFGYWGGSSGGGSYAYNGGYIMQFFPYKIYRFTVTDKSNDTVIADMKPAMRISDNAVGMYDSVRDEFYTNARDTGVFTLGNDEA